MNQLISPMSFTIRYSPSNEKKDHYEVNVHFSDGTVISNVILFWAELVLYTNTVTPQALGRTTEEYQQWVMSNVGLYYATYKPMLKTGEYLGGRTVSEEAFKFG